MDSGGGWTHVREEDALQPVSEVGDLARRTHVPPGTPHVGDHVGSAETLTDVRPGRASWRNSLALGLGVPLDLLYHPVTLMSDLPVILTRI